MTGLTQSLKTVLLLGVLTGILLFIGGLVGGRSGMTVALVVSLAMNLGSWWFSDKLVIAMTRAREVPPDANPGLHRAVSELAANAGMAKPRVYFVDDPSPNAFATGRGPGHSVVAVTRGLLEMLSEREVRGVLAHEIAHIKDRDVLVSSVAAAIAGAVMWLAWMMRWAALFGFGGGDDDEGGGNIVVLLAVSILAPVAAMFIQMAISRSREYKADAVGASVSGDPLALADALGKLSYASRRVPMRNQGASTVHHIVHPFSGGGVVRLFSTHPPIEDRIARLREMAGRGGRRGI